MTPVWLLVAAALILLPTGRRDRRPPLRVDPLVPVEADGDATLTLSPVALALAAISLAAGSVALWGLPLGAVLSGVACPVLVLGLRRLSSRTREPPPGPSLALVLDLAAAALRAGRPPPDALTAAAAAADPSVQRTLLRVAGLLRLGADPVQAWSVVGPGGALAPLAAVAVRSASSGARLAAAFERHAMEIRADAATSAVARAQRAGVMAIAPLGLCFLPSFVCLGVIPVVIGIARTAFHGFG